MSGGVEILATPNPSNGQVTINLKNWDEKDKEFCTAAEDYKDALQVCDKLNIPLRSIDLIEEYWEKVFKIFLDECKAGRTPNPDILCNKEIKFKAFLEYAKALGADQIATGHYAITSDKDGDFELKRGKDNNKDQSYFLCRLNQYQLSKSVFPIGELNKNLVREKAEKLGFMNYNKKDSTGICFMHMLPLKIF